LPIKTVTRLEKPNSFVFGSPSDGESQIIQISLEKLQNGLL
jgi:hypothetical protein